MSDAAHPVEVGPEQAPELSRLHALAFDRVWSPSDFLGFLGDGAIAYLSRANGTAVAMGLFRAIGDEAEVLTLATDPAHRGQGLAGALLAAAMGRLAAGGVRTLTLEVAADNPSARAVYDRAGFREIGRRRAYYPRPTGPVDAHVLACALDACDRA